jgi:hypothetical protein
VPTGNNGNGNNGNGNYGGYGGYGNNNGQLNRNQFGYSGAYQGPINGSVRYGFPTGTNGMVNPGFAPQYYP